MASSKMTVMSGIDFADMVKKIFAFLSSFGLTLKSNDSSMVQFESDKITIIFTYDYRRSFEVDFQILRKGSQDEIGFSSYDVADFAGIKPIPNQVTTKKGMNLVLSSYADLLRCNSSLLKGDKITFRQIEKLSNKRNSEYTNRLESEQIKAKALELWAKKDFRQYVETLKNIADELTPAERKKYEYSKKQIK